MNRDETGFLRRAARMQTDFLERREVNRRGFSRMENGAIRVRGVELIASRKMHVGGRRRAGV